MANTNDKYRVQVTVSGVIKFDRANIPAEQLLGVMHELGRDFKNGNITCQLQRLVYARSAYGGRLVVA